VKKLYDEMDFQRATPAYLWWFRSAPCAIKLAHVLFRSTPTDAHWHRALEHDCKIRPING
jgi:hypothetical protein